MALKPVPGPLTLRLHASPDTAWSELRAFLAETQHRLTIAIYDFSARHVLRAVVEALKDKPDASLLLVIHPALDAEEKEVLTTLRQQIPRCEVVMAAVSGKGEIRLFQSAFHTKVIVRDGTAFWLSSGNFSDSSQPPEDPAIPGNTAAIFRQRNRDFHVLCTDRPDLAALFEKYIHYDRDESLRHSPPSRTPPDVPERPDLLIPSTLFAVPATALAAEALPRPPELHPALDVALTPEDSVLPLFTQDNYIQEVLSLIAGARSSIRLQYQYIRPLPKAVPPPLFRELLHLLKRKIDELETVKVIVRLFPGGQTRKDLENLVGIELDINRFKVQPNVHNKAILVDGQVAVVGSQNWTGDGTVRNRDASLLIRSARVHDYYARLFEHDWERMAVQSLRGAPPFDLADGPVTPPGFVRLAWRDAFGD